MTVSLELLGQHIETLVEEVRSLRESVDAMRSEIERSIDLLAATDSSLMGIVGIHARRLTKLEREE